MIHSFIMTHACNIRDHLILFYFILSENTMMFLAMKVSDFIFYYMDRVVSWNMRWTLSANMFIELLSIDWWNKLLTSQHMFLICWIYLILNHMFSALNYYECLQQSVLCRSQTICFYNCLCKLCIFQVLFNKHGNNVCNFCLLIPLSQNVLIGYIFSVFDLLPLVLKFPHIASHL